MKFATDDLHLTRLEQEPIHLYNRIQPYGILVTVQGV
jgi:light-regulated signal transduction histidine kinase (bacteriophytochrome)